MKTSRSDTRGSYDHQVMLHSWNTFQKLRQHKGRSQNVKGKKISDKPIAPTQDNLQVSNVKRPKISSKISNSTEGLSSCNSSVKLPDKWWARSWANHRAQQAVLMRNQGKNRKQTKNCEILSIENSAKSNVNHRLRSVRSRDVVELDGKTAEVFYRLRSIYINEDERNHRLQIIRERMNEFQKKCIKKEVDQRIQEFQRKLKDDENNRRELRKLRERFLETKKERLKHMHISRNALNAPTISRVAYGLPHDGQEFSVGLSSAKTTEEIMRLWRLAFVRKQCIDNFMKKVSQMHQTLPDVTVKSQLVLPKQDSSSLVLQEPVNHTRNNSFHEEDEQVTKDSRIGILNDLKFSILDTFESSSSEDDNYDDNESN